MVKGVSRQVIVLHSPDREYFEQAIFILKDGRHSVSDETLLREARKVLAERKDKSESPSLLHRTVWAISGGAAVSLLWVLSILL